MNDQTVVVDASPAPDPVSIALVESIHKGKAYVARKYLINFQDELSTAELIGCYRKIVDSGCATDEEECALLDLIDPSQY